jgi:GGDEF domain-containing protein
MKRASVSIGVGVYKPEPGERPIDFINITYDALTKAQEEKGSKIVYS